MNPVKAAREKVRSLRHRLIYHRKHGKPAPKLTKAYQRAKSDLALAVRKARRQRSRRISRAQWGAAPARGGYSLRGTLLGLGVHHTASSVHLFGKGLKAEAAHVREVQRWHFQRGFSDIGYGFVIGPSGAIFEGRPKDKLGAHVLNHNTGTIGISLLGNYEVDTPTPAALRSLRLLVRELRAEGQSVWVKGHNEFAGHESNACPGRNLIGHVRNLPGHA